MLQFQLFRIRIQRPGQLNLFDNPRRSPRDIILAVINSKPSAQLRRGHTWHIGNIEQIDADSIYFALGRTTTAKVEMYDEEAGNFVNQEFDTAPYTHAFLDLNLQVVAIAAKAQLAPTVPGIGRQLEKLLNSSPVLLEAEAQIGVTPLSDPEDFVTHLREAFSIQKFAVTFRRPNPWDVDRDFHEPFEKFLAEADGDKGKAVIEGESLNSEPLEKVATSAAALGDDAEAQIRTARGRRPIKKRLRGNPVNFSADSADDREAKIGIVERIKEIYSRVRQQSPEQ
jgi:hypothetical protein